MQKVSRDKLAETVSEDLAVLEAHAEAMREFTILCDKIKQGGDVTFQAIDAAKAVADGYVEVRDATIRLRGLLKARALSRMAEE